MTRRVAAARVAAQCKVNLFLRILAREQSGYHQLETLFLRLELADEVTLRTDRVGRTLETRGDDVGPVEQNLAWRAALAYEATAGFPEHWAIEIDKKIPVGAGLGGGSADAGAVLRILNAISPDPIPAAALLQLASSIGADVPFLTSEAPLALAWGRGERMLSLPPLPRAIAHLSVPRFGVNTREAYGWLAAEREERGAAVPAARRYEAHELASWQGIAPLAHNDFQDVVAQRHPQLAPLIEAHRDWSADAGMHPPIALMSGSGSAVFSIYADIGGPGGGEFTINVDTGEISSLSPTAQRVMTYTATSVVPVEPID